MATPRTSNPRAQRKRPGDLTGTTVQKLNEARDANKAEKDKAAAAAAENEREVRRNTVVDYSSDPDSVAEEANEVEVEAEVPGVSVPEVKTSYSKEELEAAIAAALAARDRSQEIARVDVSDIDVDSEVEVRAKKEYIRVNYPIEDMTYGREVRDYGVFDEGRGMYTRPPRLGNLRVLNFEEGVKYLVDTDVADHLRSLGYVYQY